MTDDKGGKADPKNPALEDEKTQFQSRPTARSVDDDDDDKTLFQPMRVQEPTVGASESARSIALLDAPRTAGVLAGKGPSIELGTTINNNYVIEGVLKSGGMGSVYFGTEIGTGDPVAIKAIVPELAEDAKAGVLFKREARTLRQLSDPAIVRYYNYVHDRTLDQFFLIMEYIEGTPLSDQIRNEGKLAVGAVETLLGRLSSGLAQAHTTGVIHRDLSPDNVMLPDGDVAQARLIDFGISKSNTLTDGEKDNEFAGKYKYVSPEQLSGDDIGPGADIYGLALMMAAAAAGKALPMGTSPIAAADARLVIPDLSDIPERLRPLLSHMLEPDPALRPVSMNEVRMMLESPALIPDRYFEGGRPASHAGMTVPPVGLQVPQQRTGPLQRPATLRPAPKSDETEADSSNRALALLLTAFVVISGVLGVGAWQMGMLGDDTDTWGTVSGLIPDQTAAVAASRSGFLADFKVQPCTFLHRIGAGPNTGMIEGFSQTGEGFDGLPDAYEAQFGARPAVLPRQITAEQCAALSFARTLQANGAPAPRLEISADALQSGDVMTVRMVDVGSRATWAALVTPAGALFNLTERLSDVVGGQRTLNFGLSLADGAEAAPQLIMIVTSDLPLVRAATAPNGDRAADVLPLVLDEVTVRGAQASVGLGYVMLRPQTDE